nr:hypothetical protein [Rhizobium lusitanum]
MDQEAVTANGVDGFAHAFRDRGRRADKLHGAGGASKSGFHHLAEGLALLRKGGERSSMPIRVDLRQRLVEIELRKIDVVICRQPGEDAVDCVLIDLGNQRGDLFCVFLGVGKNGQNGEQDLAIIGIATVLNHAAANVVTEFLGRCNRVVACHGGDQRIGMARAESSPGWRVTGLAKDRASLR